MQLYLVRHPPTSLPRGLCYGRSDVALASDAAPYAEALKSLLPAGLPTFSSPLQRCRSLAQALHPEPRLDARLREMDFGTWELQPWDAIPRADLDAWAAQPLTYVPPGGESVAQVRERVGAFLEELAVLDAGPCVLVTHAGVMKVCCGLLLNLPQEEWQGMRFAFGAATYLERGRLIWHDRR